jgi:hypothetical protein
MERKHSTRQILEARVRSAVEQETPDVKNQILKSLEDHPGIRTRKVRRRRRPVLKYAVSFAAVALVVVGALALPNAARPARMPAPGSSKAQSAERQAQRNPFTLTAYAAGKGSVSSGSQKQFGLSLTRPISVSGIDCTKFVGFDEGRSIYDDSELLKKENGTQTYAQYVGFNLKCVGEHIKSVTFTADRGGFAKIVSLTEQEAGKIGDSIPYNVEEARKTYQKDKKNYEKKVPGYHYTIPDPNPNYGDGKSVELGSAWGLEKEQIEHDGFLPVGKSYTISYADQDDYTKQYACRITKTFTDAEVERMDRTGMKELFHQMSREIDGTIVTITATYEDGSAASKQCVLTLDPDTWIFTAVEK